MASDAAEKPHSQTMQDGPMAPSQDCLGVLLECLRSAWEGREEAASCASRFLACVAGAEQEEQLRRVLSFVEAVRGPLLEQLEGKEARAGGGGVGEQTLRKRARSDAGNDDNEDGRIEPQETRRAEAKAKGEARPGLSGQSSTAAVAAPAESAASIHVHEGMSCGVKGVLLDGDLLGCVWGFVLGGSGRQDVCVLGQLSVVCRKWREVSLWDAWWVGIKEDMLPLLWEEEEEGREEAGSSRGRVMGYGRFLEGQRGLVKEPQSDEEWLQGLEGHVEVFDRMDGLQILSLTGPLSYGEDWFTEDLLSGELDISEFHPVGPRRLKFKRTAFSAASRDPQRRFATIQEYLRRGYREEYPCCLCVRVTLRDMRTGRMALIWEEYNCRSRAVYGLIPNTRSITYHSEARCRRNVIGTRLRQDSTYFHLFGVENQGDDVGEQDLLYHLDPLEWGFSCYFTGLGGGDEGASLAELREVVEIALNASPMHLGWKPVRR